MGRQLAGHLWPPAGRLTLRPHPHRPASRLVDPEVVRAEGERYELSEWLVDVVGDQLAELIAHHAVGA